MAKTAVPLVWRSKKVRGVFRTIREGHGIGQGEMARRIGIAESKLNRWENNTGELKQAEIEKYADILDAAIIDRAESHPRNVPGSIGQYCKRVRADYGIGQCELAEEMEMAQSNISMFENGYVNFTPEELERLDAAMEVLKKKHGGTAHLRKLFNDVVSSLRRELAKAEGQSQPHAEASEEGKMKLSSLLGKRGD